MKNITQARHQINGNRTCVFDCIAPNITNERNSVMNSEVVINGQKYTFVQIIEDIVSKNTVVLCKDERGCL